MVYILKRSCLLCLTTLFLTVFTFAEDTENTETDNKSQSSSENSNSSQAENTNRMVGAVTPLNVDKLESRQLANVIFNSYRSKRVFYRNQDLSSCKYNVSSVDFYGSQVVSGIKYVQNTTVTDANNSDCKPIYCYGERYVQQWTKTDLLKYCCSFKKTCDLQENNFLLQITEENFKELKNPNYVFEEPSGFGKTILILLFLAGCVIVSYVLWKRSRKNDKRTNFVQMH